MDFYPLSLHSTEPSFLSFCKLTDGNIQLGKEFTRETLAAAVAEAPPHSPVAVAFEEAQIEAFERLCR